MSKESTDRDLALARDAMRARAQPLDPARRARLWARIDQPTRAAVLRRLVSQGWWWMVLGTAAATAVAAAFFLRAPAVPRVERGTLRAASSIFSAGDPVPIGRRLVSSEATRVDLHDVDLWLKPSAELVLSSPRLLNFESGAIELAIAPSTSPFVLVTPEARMFALGGRMLVERTPGRTRLEVTEGQIELSVVGRDDRTLHAGEVEIISAEVAVAPVPEPVPEPVAPVQNVAKSTPRKLPALRPAVVKTPPGAAGGSPEEEPVRRVEEARSLVQRDAPRARAMAEDVLDKQPAPEVRVQASMVLADALRLEGNRERAAHTYGWVAGSPAAGAFLEEAMLRQAQLYGELGRRSQALEILQRANERVAGGLLLPERIALTSDLHLDEGRPLDAAATLERTGDQNARALHRARLRVARKLVSSAPIRARRLLEPVLASSDPHLTQEAHTILDQLPPGEAKNF